MTGYYPGFIMALINQQRITTLYLTWLGAAGFKIETDEGAVILIDPFLSRPTEATPVLPLSMSDLLPVDEIFLTHGQFEHALDTPALVKQTGAIVHAPGPVCQRLAEAGVSPHNLECISLGTVKRVGSVTWQAYLTQPAEVADTSPSLRSLKGSRETLFLLNILARQWPTGETVAYFFQTGSFSLLYNGRAGRINTDIERLRPNVALLPVESTSPDTAVLELAAQLKPNLVIPHHWDNYYPPLSAEINLTDFEAAMQNHTPPLRVYKPVLGERFKVTEMG